MRFRIQTPVNLDGLSNNIGIYLLKKKQYWYLPVKLAVNNNELQH
jgi:hypothetical protein